MRRQSGAVPGGPDRGHRASTGGIGGRPPGPGGRLRSSLGRGVPAGRGGGAPPPPQIRQSLPPRGPGLGPGMGPGGRGGGGGYGARGGGPGVGRGVSPYPKQQQPQPQPQQQPQPQPRLYAPAPRGSHQARLGAIISRGRGVLANEGQMEDPYDDYDDYNYNYNAAAGGYAGGRSNHGGQRAAAGGAYGNYPNRPPHPQQLRRRHPHQPPEFGAFANFSAESARNLAVVETPQTIAFVDRSSSAIGGGGATKGVRDDDTFVSAMNDSTATGWLEEQSYIARRQKRPGSRTSGQREGGIDEGDGEYDDDDGDDDVDDAFDDCGSVMEMREFRKFLDKSMEGPSAGRRFDARNGPRGRAGEHGRRTAGRNMAANEDQDEYDDYDDDYCYDDDHDVDLDGKNNGYQGRNLGHAAGRNTNTGRHKRFDDFAKGERAYRDGDYKSASLHFLSALKSRENALEERIKDKPYKKDKDNTGNNHDKQDDDDDENETNKRNELLNDLELDVARARERLADSCVQLGEAREAHGLYQSCLKSYTQIRRNASSRRVLLGIGDLYRVTGNYARALRYYDRALIQSTSAPDNDNDIDIYNDNDDNNIGPARGGKTNTNAAMMAVKSRKRRGFMTSGPDAKTCAARAVDAHAALAGRAIECGDREMTLFHYREVMWLSRILQGQVDQQEGGGEKRGNDGGAQVGSGTGAGGGGGAGATGADSESSQLSLSSARFLIDPDVRAALLAGLHTSALSREDAVDDPETSRSYLKEAMRLLNLTGGSGTTEGISAVMDNIASILIKERKPDSAMRCLEEKLDMLTREYGGEKHMDVADCLAKLGATAARFGRLDLAVGYFDRAVRTNRKLPKKERGMDAPTAVRGRASSHLAVGNHGLALKCYKEYLGVCLPDERPVIFHTMGIIQTKLYQFSDALGCYKEALQIASAATHPLPSSSGGDGGANGGGGGGGGAKETLASIANLQDIFLCPKSQPKVRDPYERALDSQDMRNVLLNLGAAQLRRVKTDRTTSSRSAAKALVREVLRALDFDDGSVGRVDLPVVLRSMGNVLSRRGRSREAADYYGKCVKAFSNQKAEKEKGGSGPMPTPQDLFELHTDLGTVLLKTGEFEDASAEHFRRALEELQKCHLYMNKPRDKGGGGGGKGGGGGGGDGRHAPSLNDQIRYFLARNGDPNLSRGGKLTKREALRNCHLVGLALTRFGLFDDAVRTLDSTLARTSEAYGENSTDAARLCADVSGVCALRGDDVGARRIFEGAMQRMQRGAKVPYHHPFMSHLRRLYELHFADEGEEGEGAGAGAGGELEGSNVQVGGGGQEYEEG